jgi:hypothetical protein
VATSPRDCDDRQHVDRSRPRRRAVPERRSEATQYPDMWVDPGDDPRSKGGFTDERSLLIGYLRDYRLTLRMKCDGLDAEQLARRSVPPSTM